jgi:hypothetical protein
MDWELFYQSGAVVTYAIAVFTIFRMEDLSQKQRYELGVIFLFGLLIWPITMLGLIVLNNQMASFKTEV